MTITFTDKTEQEVENSRNSDTVKFSDLLPAIDRLIKLRDYEQIDGLVINGNQEIKVAFSRKTGAPKKKNIQEDENQSQ
jgi:hypothetical protein